MKLRPPIVIDPTREKDALLGATEYCTVPSPLPVPPDVTVSHVTLLAEDQAHPVWVATPIDPEDPAALIEMDVGVRLSEHAAPAWVIVNVWPDTVMVPVRCVGDGFAATL